MTIDLSKLSAKELFELALRKEQQEQKQAQRQVQLIDLQKRRALLMSAHQAAIAEIEKRISELTSQRGKLIAEHDKTMTVLGKELTELTRQIQETERAEKAKQAAAPSIAARPAPAVPQVAPAPVAPPPLEATPVLEEETPGEEGAEALIIDDKDELFEKIRDLMRTRSFISHGLLKEQLKVKGYSVPNLSKLVDQLIRDGKLASAGGGNYALGKKA